MGDPKKRRKQYSTPSHPWQKERIEEENILSKDYGLKNKKEIWRVRSMLGSFKTQAKKIMTLNPEQMDREKTLLLARLRRLGLINENAELDDVLGLTIKNLMDRRLQNIVKKKGMARTEKQARQFIVHEHIKVAGNKITSPSYIVPIEDEPSVTFTEKSKLSDATHPERSTVASVRKVRPAEAPGRGGRETRGRGGRNNKSRDGLRNPVRRPQGKGAAK